MTNIKNIVFDMGGVLIDLDREACVRAFEEIGYSEAATLLDPYLQRGVFLQHEKGEITPVEFREFIKNGIKGGATDEQIDNALNKFLVRLPIEKLRMLRELKKHYRVFMLSNTNPIMLDFIDKNMFSQEGLTVDDYFDYRYLSHEMKVLKPSDEIYLRMAEHGNMKPEETLFIDDSQANVEAARKLGFNVYLAQPEEDYSHIFESL